MSKLYFIADISANHENNLDKAYKLIEASAKSGASAAKFQAFKADKLINKEAFKDLKIGHQKKWGGDVYDVYKKYELNLDWIPNLARCCRAHRIDFMCTPYDFDALKAIDPYVEMHKIGSGDINYFPLLTKVRETNKRALLGTGASTLEDIKNALNILKEDTVLMHCNTNYTSNDSLNIEYANLKLISHLNMEGISDHTKNNHLIVLAIAFGAKFIERHFKLDKNDSPDNDFSMTPQKYKDMVIQGYDALRMLGDGIKKIEHN